ncbi:MAG: D-alanyl-D-alanine carboxypeptidase family protein [Candidatus Fimadaptatus sp.]
MNRRIMPIISALLMAAMLLMVGANGAMVSARAEAGVKAPLESDVPFELSCASALLLEASTGREIFALNADDRRPVASVNKLMPILLVLEALESDRCALDDMVTVSRRAEGMGGSQALLDAGASYEFGELFKSVIVGSANDSTVALGEYLYGSEEGMVAAMNRRAAELGMNDTCFVNSTGLPAQGHYTTARDIARLSREVIAHEAYFDYSTIWLDELKHPSGRITQLTNTNRLTRLYDGCDGIKTGSTNEAGFCMSASAKRGDMRLIAVVLGAPSSKERFADASALLDHGFANYSMHTAARRGDIVERGFPVIGGDPQRVDIVLDGDCVTLIERGGAADIRLERTLPDVLNAPLSAGQVVGSVRVMLGERVLREIDAVVAQDVSVRGLGEGVRRVLRLWFYM